MTKHVLITAGTVYGLLDDNKLVGNRVRGIWATRFADWLANFKPYKVTLLVADTQAEELGRRLRYADFMTVETHRGFEEYREKVLQKTAESDAVVLAAAVVNWVPAKLVDGRWVPGQPVAGKMKTAGFETGQMIQVPFVLAPRVIDEVKATKQCLLIGCKMTIGAEHDHLIDEAYTTLLRSRSNAVIANDMGRDLAVKHIVYPDRTVVAYNVKENAQKFYLDLRQLIDDEHWSTGPCWGLDTTEVEEYRRAATLFDALVERYRTGFVCRVRGEDKVLGALAVRLDRDCAMVSPREKGQSFTSQDAVYPGVLTQDDITQRTLYVTRPPGSPQPKASLNAPLLMRHLTAYPKAVAVLHQHRQIEGVPTVPYAPPGTSRDNLRAIPGPVYNIEGHGFIAALDDNGDMMGGL